MRNLLFLLLISFSLPTWAADHFVCATAQGAQDGSTAADCKTWSFSDNEFAAGDTLYVLGTIDRSTTFLFDDLGTSTSPITIRGDYSGYPPGALSNSGNSTATPVLQLGSAGEPASYVIVRNLTVQNSSDTGPCILDSSLGAGGGFNQFINLTVKYCGTYAILIQKPNAVIDNSDISYCDDDCVAATSAGTSLTLKNSTISYYSQATTTGDAVFINTAQTNSDPSIINNTIYWDNNNSTKQGFIGGVDSGTLRILHNKFISRVGTSQNHAISVESAGNYAEVGFNSCDGFRACITHFSSGALGIDGILDIHNNIANRSQYGVFITTTIGTPKINITGNICNSCVYRGIDVSGTGTDVYINNNYIDMRNPSSAALYISNSINSMSGDRNNYYPEATGFIQNYECGTSYATLAAYKAGCGSVEQNSTTTINPFPRTASIARTTRN